MIYSPSSGDLFVVFVRTIYAWPMSREILWCLDWFLVKYGLQYTEREDSQIQWINNGFGVVNTRRQIDVSSGSRNGLVSPCLVNMVIGDVLLRDIIWCRLRTKVFFDMIYSTMGYSYSYSLTFRVDKNFLHPVSTPTAFDWFPLIIIKWFARTYGQCVLIILLDKSKVNQCVSLSRCWPVTHSTPLIMLHRHCRHVLNIPKWVLLVVVSGDRKSVV